MPGPLLPRAPIDEVVFSFVLSTPTGLDATEAGLYLAERTDRFPRHEVHEPIVNVNEPGWIEMPPPVRVWLVSADDGWLVQLQRDRFLANWRKRGTAAYPGFTRSGGAMQFALDEFSRFQAFCQRIHGGEKPVAATVDVSKIDLLVQGREWHEVAEALEIAPALKSAARWFSKPPTENIAIHTQEQIGPVTLVTSIAPARLRANPLMAAFRLEFRAVQPAGEDLAAQFTAINAMLNDAFGRVIPDYAARFA
ncbi:MAG TPA: hypothetical protein VMJ10_30005 [Kofleriaceae bacterium]|nr:hypothetical protein [Kofleriaceae bacterium]